MSIEEEYHHKMSSDDDDAPEEVGKETAERGALEQLERERSAKVAATEAAKSKRRAEIERNTEQQRAKRERQDIISSTSASLNKISYDLLAKVAAKRKQQEDQLVSSETSESEDVPTKKSKPKQPQNKRTTVFKTLETEATTFIAVNLKKDLSNPVTSLRKDKTTCYHFRDRMLFDKKRLRRAHSGQVFSYQAKRAASKHS